MENKQNDKKKEDAITSLPRLEMYAVLGLELGQRIFEQLQEMEDSLEDLARQKSRELNPDQDE